MGIWGNVTASVDWCEPNYFHSIYVAEWWNTLSSIPIMISGMLGMWNSWSQNFDFRIFFYHFMMTWVGLGSVAFHGTLLLLGQALDELSMIYATLILLFIVLEMDSPKGHRRYPYLIPFLFLYAIFYTFVYFFIPGFFPIFVVSYISTVLYLFYKCYTFYRNTGIPSPVRKLLIIGITTYVSCYFIFWLPDFHLCQYTQDFNFHAWFHLGATIAPYCCVIFVTYERLRRTNKHSRVYFWKNILPLIERTQVKQE